MRLNGPCQCFSALCAFFSNFFVSSSFLIFCSKLYFQKAQRVPPLQFSALWDCSKFIFRFFFENFNFFEIFQCLQRVPPSIFFDILQQTGFSKSTKGPQFTILKTLRCLSLRYSADFRRSRLVYINNWVSGIVAFKQFHFKKTSAIPGRPAELLYTKLSGEIHFNQFFCIFCAKNASCSCTVAPRFTAPFWEYLVDYVKGSLRCFEHYLFVYLILIGLEIKLRYYEKYVIAMVRYKKARLCKTWVSLVTSIAEVLSRIIWSLRSRDRNPGMRLVNSTMACTQRMVISVMCWNLRLEFSSALSDGSNSSPGKPGQGCKTCRTLLNIWTTWKNLSNN